MAVCKFCGRGLTSHRAQYCTERSTCRVAAKRQRDRERRVLDLVGFSHYEADDFRALAVTYSSLAAQLIRTAYHKHGVTVARLMLRACRATWQRDFPRE